MCEIKISLLKFNAILYSNTSLVVKGETLVDILKKNVEILAYSKLKVCLFIVTNLDKCVGIK